ncbi:MAG: hypothetical protein ABIB04_02890 [Patescibacteria group bacterium]
MKFEQPATPERMIPELTNAQHVDFLAHDSNYPELIAWMKKNGVEFDVGEINVLIDGVPTRIDTNKKDFGVQVSGTGREVRLGERPIENSSGGKVKIISSGLEQALKEREDRSGSQNQSGGYRRVLPPKE